MELDYHGQFEPYLGECRYPAGIHSGNCCGGADQGLPVGGSGNLKVDVENSQIVPEKA
jgi:hypothetical protein